MPGHTPVTEPWFPVVGAGADQQVTSASAPCVLKTVPELLPKRHAQKKGWVRTASDHWDLQARDDINGETDSISGACCNGCWRRRERAIPSGATGITHFSTGPPEAGSRAG